MNQPNNNAFIKQFEHELPEAYQRGFRLRNTARTIRDINGSSAVFNTTGKLVPLKSNAAMVPVMNFNHPPGNAR